MADRIRRPADVVAALLGLVLASPLLLGIAVWLRSFGTRPVLHSELRVGRGGHLFPIHKFRTFRPGSSTRPTVATSDDPRVTPSGRFLRRWRLDELPQLWNVLVGEMSLVGPRPQRPENLVSVDPRNLACVQQVRPGITGPSAIEALGEDEALAAAADPERVYRERILPEKVAIECAWLERRTLCSDVTVLARTAWRIFSARSRAVSRAYWRERVDG